MFDVFGIGNPLLDAIVKVDDKHLVELDLRKGTMHLVDNQVSKETLEKFKDHEITFIPGGDVVNTMSGIANLGGKTIFCGKVGIDKHGMIIEQTMNDDNIKPVLVQGNVQTGTCISLVTPDNERTMITDLGAAITFKEKELILDDVKRSKLVYVTGYFLEDEVLRTISLRVLEEAKKHGKLIAIDVSDSALIERTNGKIQEIIEKYADIVFANEEEVKALTGKSEEEGLEELSKVTKIAIVKIGKKGALVKENDKVFKVPGFEVKAIDTTGAGDNFAAGFLYGITNGYTSEQSARIGNYVASRAVLQYGGRLKDSLKKDIKALFE